MCCEVQESLQDTLTMLLVYLKLILPALVPDLLLLKMLFQKIILHFHKTRSVVTQVELIEKKGDRTIIELKNIKTNAAINTKVFPVN